MTDPSIARFHVPLGLGEVIAGTVELHENDVFMVITERPSLMEELKAKSLIADALCRGRDLGIRPAFAGQVRAALEVSHA